ncbi:hypothetical protein GCM10027160_43230 [Streptomyces calidiresistens]
MDHDDRASLHARLAVRPKEAHRKVRVMPVPEEVRRGITPRSAAVIAVAGRNGSPLGPRVDPGPRSPTTPRSRAPHRPGERRESPEGAPPGSGPREGLDATPGPGRRPGSARTAASFVATQG